MRIHTPQPKSRGIYIATNRVNSKQFVGMDSNMPLRFHQHVIGSAKCQMLHEALSDTGLENWNVQFIPYPKLSLKDLQALKRWYIDKLKTEHPNGYNPPLVSNGNLEWSENVLQLLKARVRERRKAGALLATIGAEFGIDSTTVSRWCEDIKVLTPTETEIIGLLADGPVWTSSDIQQRSKVTHHRVQGVPHFICSDIQQRSKVTRQAVMRAFGSLVENGLITRIKKGCYQKSGEGASCENF